MHKGPILHDPRRVRDNLRDNLAFDAASAFCSMGFKAGNKMKLSALYKSETTAPCLQEESEVPGPCTSNVKPSSRPVGKLDLGSICSINACNGKGTDLCQNVSSMVSSGFWVGQRARA